VLGDVSCGVLEIHKENITSSANNPIIFMSNIPTREIKRLCLFIEKSHTLKTERERYYRIMIKIWTILL